MRPYATSVCGLTPLAYEASRRGELIFFFNAARAGCSQREAFEKSISQDLAAATGALFFFLATLPLEGALVCPL